MLEKRAEGQAFCRYSEEPRLPEPLALRFRLCALTPLLSSPLLVSFRTCSLPFSSTWVTGCLKVGNGSPVWDSWDMSQWLRILSLHDLKLAEIREPWRYYLQWFMCFHKHSYFFTSAMWQIQTYWFSCWSWTRCFYNILQYVNSLFLCTSSKYICEYKHAQFNILSACTIGCFCLWWSDNYPNCATSRLYVVSFI